MERQELNHLILNTDETASGDETGLPTFDEGPQQVDPMVQRLSRQLRVVRMT